MLYPIPVPSGFAFHVVEVVFERSACNEGFARGFVELIHYVARGRKVEKRALYVFGLLSTICRVEEFLVTGLSVGSKMQVII